MIMIVKNAWKFKKKLSNNTPKNKPYEKNSRSEDDYQVPGSFSTAQMYRIQLIQNDENPNALVREADWK